jgi:hypothetical protein
LLVPLGLLSFELVLPLGDELPPEAAPPEVWPDELPAPDDGLFDMLDELPDELPAPALWSRLQPASARARDAARMASSFI